MTELSFHHVILAMMGVAGLLWFCASLYERHLWSKRRRLLVSLILGCIFLNETLGAFASLANASSLELFGFIGCFLGCLGAVRLACSELESTQVAPVSEQPPNPSIERTDYGKP
jgi:hypothetical protein